MADLREILVKIATRSVAKCSALLMPGYHMVVVVTDENGDYVGVHATSDRPYTMRILKAALCGEELVNHRSVTP